MRIQSARPSGGQMASFDVFDTVLTRLCGAPRQVFVATGRRLREEGVLDLEPETYAAVREEAVRLLTSDIGRHPSLQCIAEDVAARLALPKDQAARLMSAELAVEQAVCRAVPGARERVARARQETGRGVVFVSDTPLPTQFLRDLLAREKLLQDGDHLFASADAGASKQEGGLFTVVARQLGLPPAAFRHVGDDRWADVAHPRLHGWRAEHDPRAALTTREVHLNEAAAVTDGLSARLAGASRLGRLAAAEEGADIGLAAIAGSVALPLLVGFGLWVLQQAEILQLDRLYFVARDGEVLLGVVRSLAERSGSPVECRYLHGSRRAWQLANLSVLQNKADLWVPDDLDPEGLTERQVLALIGLTPEEARGIAGFSALPVGQGDHVLGTAGWAQMCDLLANGPLAREVSRRAGDRRDLLLRYLSQEGVTSGDPVGLVDIGWTGRAVRMLEEVIDEAGAPAPTAHLFLGLRGTAPEQMGADLFSRSWGWLIDEARGRRIPPEAGADLQKDPVRLLESFAMGSEGHTTGFAPEGDRVVPILSAEKNPAALHWGFGDYRRALTMSLNALLEGPFPPSNVDLRSVVWRQLLDFWRHPTEAEARAWGAQPYGDDFQNAGSHPMATPLTTRRLMTKLGIGSPAWREPTYWVAGSIVLSRQPWRSTLLFADRLRPWACKLPRIRARLRREWAFRSPARSIPVRLAFRSGQSRTSVETPTHSP